MSSTTFTVHTGLSPSEVLGLMTDFGPRGDQLAQRRRSPLRGARNRADWAEVTEGTAIGVGARAVLLGRGRRHDRDRDPDSNLWATGSGWRYQLAPPPAARTCVVTLHPGAEVDHRATARSLIPVVDGRTLGEQLESVFRKAGPAEER